MSRSFAAARLLCAVAAGNCAFDMLSVAVAATDRPTTTTTATLLNNVMNNVMNNNNNRGTGLFGLFEKTDGDPCAASALRWHARATNKQTNKQTNDKQCY
jgi:hypothetical protein